MFGRIAVAAGAGEHPGERRMERFEGWETRPVADVAIARRMTINEPRIEGVQLLPADAQLFHRTDAHVVVDDVSLAHEVMDDTPTLGRFEIDREALLAALHAEQNAQLRTAHRIAAVFLDLDHARAEISKEAIGKRSRHVGTEVEDDDAVERADPRGRLRDTRSIDPITAVTARTVRERLNRVAEKDGVMLAHSRDVAANFDRRAAELGEPAQLAAAVGGYIDEFVVLHLLQPKRLTGL